MAFVRGVDIVPVLTEARDLGLFGAGYVWLATASAYTSELAEAFSEGELSGYMYAEPRVAGKAEKRQLYEDAWPSVSRRYNLSVDGLYDRSTGLPFFGDDIYSPTIWDTDYAPVGDGKPDYWGAFVYDTVWLYAVALANLTAEGLAPTEGAALRQKLLQIDYQGVTGRIRFHPTTQDRGAEYDILNVQVLEDGSYTSVPVEAPETVVQWLGGVIAPPYDGSALDPTKTYLEPPAATVDTRTTLNLEIHLLNSFGVLAVAGNVSEITVSILDNAGEHRPLPSLVRSLAAVCAVLSSVDGIFLASCTFFSEGIARIYVHHEAHDGRRTQIKNSPFPLFVQRAGAVVAVRLGVLIRMFHADSNASPSSASALVVHAVYQALKEINNKTDGVFDHVLPRTRLEFAYEDSRCDPSYSVQGAARLLETTSGGNSGVSAIIGASCSDASAVASYVAKSSAVPMISPSSTSPTLSRGVQFPFFLRTAASDSFQVLVIVHILNQLFNYSSIALVSSGDNYGVPFSDAFKTEAHSVGMRVYPSVVLIPWETEFNDQYRSLLEARSRIIVMLSSQAVASRFLSGSIAARVGGPGYLWFVSDAIANEDTWQLDPGLSTDLNLRTQVFKGMFGVIPSPSVSAALSNFLDRRRTLLVQETDSNGCSLGKDDSGNYVFQRYTDGNASSSPVCVSLSDAAVSNYAPYAYDAATALAHALHDLLEVQNRTEIVGSELLDTLITRVRFEGVSGLVDFYDASADPDLLYHGDRRVGVTYELINYVDASQGFVAVGTWQPCGADAGCSWSEQWHEEPGVGPTFSTADNRKPSQVAQAISEVRIGVLLGMFLTAEGGYQKLEWSPRVGVFQALREFNNKTDGVADDLLPGVRLRVAFKDPKCDAATALQSSLHLLDAFDSDGVSAIIGASCSGASVTAAQVAQGAGVPIISPSSTSPLLSDGRKYPYFLRVVPSDAFAAVAMLRVLQRLWNYTAASLVHSTDAYGSGLADALSAAALDSGFTIGVTVRFAKDTTDFRVHQLTLRRSSARVILLSCQISDGSRFLRSAYESGVGGEGYLFIGGDTFYDSGLWEGDVLLSSNIALRESVLRGLFCVSPRSRNVGAPRYESYLARRKQLPPIGDDTDCNLETDDTGTLLWAQDHDSTASTPLKCDTRDLSRDGVYDALGYDAVFAILYALHDLLEVQNRTEIVGSELLDTLITRVRFEGVSGLVDFYDASADPDLLYHGDRRVGVTYELINYVDASLGFVAVGTWQPCGADAGCSWSEQWHEEPGVGPTFSTADNRKPSQVAQEAISEVRIGVLLGMFLTAEGGYQKLEWSPRVGVFQALREFNNKTDGVADDLLPGVRLRVAFKDPKCDAATALQSSLHLLDAFDSDGVSAIIGAGCSGASVTAAQVAQGAGVPIISPSSTSPLLSDGRKYPYFLRVVPSDAFAAVAMLRVLQRLWNYTAASLVHSTDAYGSGLADALSAAALDSGFTIGVTVRFAKDTTDFRVHQLTLRRSSARVILLSCQISDGSRFLRSAYESGVGGEGYLFMGGDSFYDSGLWEGDVLLSSNIALRESVLRGLFCVFPRSRNVGAPRYESYLARRKQLPPIGDDTDCNLETDDTGTLLWAQDHDSTASTPLKCDTRDLSRDGVYDALGYDAVFAILYALHDLLEVQNRTEIVGSELLDTLITRVRFEGVSGLVDFYDASADPDLLYHGDRRVGVTYELINYVDASQGFVAVGTWQPCGADAGCSWHGHIPWLKALLDSLPLLLFIALVFTPTTSTSIFAAWSCESFEVDSLSQPPVTVQYLRGDLSILCDQSRDDYSRITVLAYILVAIWSIGVPLSLLLVLVLNRQSIAFGRSTRIVGATRLLCCEYHKARY
ncbi:hypothetical protein AB1Y20_000200 [Prymnesium parvum]|uniref:Receptor ligand binding region domain-containing protein n=1 Tax=Prymnesium parvum TaxID=97485 RepID=A0AB34K4S0_PRYPA